MKFARQPGHVRTESDGAGFDTHRARNRFLGHRRRHAVLTQSSPSSVSVAGTELTGGLRHSDTRGRTDWRAASGLRSTFSHLSPERYLATSRHELERRAVHQGDASSIPAVRRDDFNSTLDGRSPH